MSRIHEALERYRKEVVEEAREGLDELREKADNSMDAALAKLNMLVDTWDRAAAQLTDFDLAMIADIYMNGGLVWAFTSKVPTGLRIPSMNRSVFEIIKHMDVIYSSGDSYHLAPKMLIEYGKEYEFVVIIKPKDSNNNAD